MRRLHSILVLLALISTIGVARSGTVRQAEGSSDIVVEGVSSDADSKIGETLPEGAVITTGNDGRIVIEVAPGILLELQPDAQLTIGASDPNGGVDSESRTIPRISLNLMSGGVVVHASGDSLEAASVVIVTPKGSFSPASPGITVVSATAPTSPEGTVTIASLTGSGVLTTTEGEQDTLGDGLMVVLGSAAPSKPVTISDSPQAGQLAEIAQASASRIASLPAPSIGLSTTSTAPAPTPRPMPAPAFAPTAAITSTSEATPTPAATPRATPVVEATPSPVPDESPAPTPTANSEATPTPTATPRATVAPTATPRPTPEPTATPRPTPIPSPTATPRPTPSPTATPRPTPSPTATPRPTPSPTATPRPTPSPTATPRPTPTPTPTPRPTPVSP